MMVSRILIEQRESLRVFSRYVHSANFCAALSGQIAEFKRFDITADQICGAFPEEPRLLELAGIYRAYERAMSGVFTDNEDRMNWMIERIPQADFLRDAFVAIDEFEMLTSQVYRTVRALLSTARDVLATFRLGSDGDGDAPLFALEKKHLLRMQTLAADAGQRVEIVNLPEGEKRRHADAGALAHLERSLFVASPPAYEGIACDVALFTAPTMRRESGECARRVLTLVREAGYRFRDIAVVAADLSGYGPLLDEAFSLFGIPSFLDTKRNVLTHPLARYALLSLKVLQSGFLAKDVLSLVKTGMSRLDAEEADEFEEIVRISGVRYLGPSMDEHYRSLYPKLCEYKDRLLCAHNALLRRMREADSASLQSEAFTLFFAEDGLIDRQNALLDSMQAQGDADSAMELRQVYEVLCSLLSQMHTVMGDARMTLKAYYDHLGAGLFAQEVGVLPSVVDAVQVGTVGRSRSGAIKALFVLGVNDGLIPRTLFDSGLLTGDDQKALSAASLFMGNGRAERIREERQGLYALLFKPTKRLTLSYAQSNLSGEQLTPSPLLSAVRACLPSLTTQTATGDEDTDIQTPASTLLPLAAAIRQSRLTSSPLPPAYGRALSILLPTLGGSVRSWLERGVPEEEAIGRELACAAYPDVRTGSATALEVMARCPFRHFATYALMQPPPLRDYGHTAGDVGSYYHAIADGYVKALQAADLPPQLLTREQSDAILDALCGAYDEDSYLTGPYRRDGREREKAHWNRRRLKHACWQLKEQLQDEGFVPVATESAYARTIRLDGGERANVSGTIDRVDLGSIDGRRVARVVDYKTGAAAFSYTDLYHGISLQLPLYADMAAQRHEAESVGMFIQPLQKALINSPPEEAQQTLDGEMALDGAYTDLCLAASGPDSRLGRSKKKDRLLDRLRFDQLLGVGIRRAAQLMQKRIDGQCEASPLYDKNDDSCEYCVFGAACGFDPSIHGVRRKRKMDGPAFFEAIEREAEA
jgi:ATP-dependent helicase/nuclease subunit B